MDQVSSNASSSPEVTMLHASLIWLGLFSAELVASFVLRNVPSDGRYFGAAITLTLLLWLATGLLGKSALVRDIQEIALYDVLVQWIGLLAYWRGSGILLFMTLANTVNVMKSVRLVWPILAQLAPVPGAWPVFGLLGWLRARTRSVPAPCTPRQARFVFGLFPFCLLGGYGLACANDAWHGIPLSSGITVTLVFFGTNRLIAHLERQEAQLRQAHQATAMAEGEARANAQLVQSLQKAKAAEVAAHQATLQLLAQLSAHNSRLGDSAHSLKVMLAPLFFQSGALLEHADNDELRHRARAVMEEVELIGGKLVRLIDQAYIHPTVDMGVQRDNVVAIAPLCTYFFDRFNEMACDADVSLDVTAIDMDHASVLGHEETLKDLIGNLLINAIKHGAPGDVAMTLIRMDQHVQIRVENGGMGIANAHGPDWASNFARVVEHQTKTSLDAQQQDAMERRVAHLIQTGNKIGLRSVAHMADDLHCVMQLHSVPGKKTIFQFNLPLAS